MTKRSGKTVCMFLLRYRVNLGNVITYLFRVKVNGNIIGRFIEIFRKLKVSERETLTFCFVGNQNHKNERANKNVMNKNNRR